MDNLYHWRLGKLTLRLHQGDIFEVPAKALVNSEQSDFALALGGHSISAQIRRLEDAVQEELYEQTKGETMPVGTVLQTIGAGAFAHIFHAGFHHPTVFLDRDSDDHATEHIKIIRSCIRQILAKAQSQKLDSIAFPLIGCGLFGLDFRLLAYEFFEEIAQFAAEVPIEREMIVWLTIFQSEQFMPTLQAGIQAWVDQMPIVPQQQAIVLGINFLDLFAEHVVRAKDPQWAAWMWVRYAELVTCYLHAVVAQAMTPSIEPAACLAADRPVSFGLLRSNAYKYSDTVHTDSEGWTRFLASLLHRDGRGDKLLERINVDRNNIAHGRSFRSVDEIRDDLQNFLQLAEWQQLREDCGPPPATLSPWVCPRHREAPQIAETTGVLESWSEKKAVYVIPHSGSRFTIRANSSGKV